MSLRERIEVTALGDENPAFIEYPGPATREVPELEATGYGRLTCLACGVPLGPDLMHLTVTP